MDEIEVTRTITVEITVIANVEEYIPATEEAKQEFAEEIKDFLHADDVLVTKVQDFIMDEEGAQNTPTIEAKSVEHAHWEMDNWCESYCSNCGNYALFDDDEREYQSEYCPFCGAQMDEKGAHNG